MDKELFEQNIGREQSNAYYLKALSHYKGKFEFISWNWSAFFFSNYWLVYRRLYGTLFLFIFLDYCLAFLIMMLCCSLLYFFNEGIGIAIYMKKVFNPQRDLLYWSSFTLFFVACRFLFGVFGTTLYLRNIDRRIQKGKKPLGKNSYFTTFILTIMIFTAVNFLEKLLGNFLVQLWFKDFT
jgi:hypothetical protein